MTEHSLLQDATFWTSVAFVIFVLLVIWKARPAIKSAVGGRIEAIRAELDTAESLKEEAHSILAEIQRQQRDALKQAEEIVAHAKAEVKHMKAEARKKLDESLARREAQAMDKITQAETQAIQEVRNLAVDRAMSAATQILADQMSGKDGNKLVEDAIADLGGKLH